MKPALHIRGMKGLGDNLFQRPFVKAACRRHSVVYLETPWPEVYADLRNVRPLRTFTPLRTQQRNERRAAMKYTVKQGPALKAFFTYGHHDLAKRSILQSLELGVPLNEGDRLELDLPPACRVSPMAGRYAVVRPATVRTEWSNPNRNPRPEYLAEAAAALRAEGIRVIVVADLVPGVEDLVGELPPHDAAFLAGELSTTDLLGLVSGAVAVVGGVGWLVPAAIAAKVPALIVLGGNGAHNAPEKITDPRLDLSRLTFARPDELCMCNGKGHECGKRITGFQHLSTTWSRSISPA